MKIFKIDAWTHNTMFIKIDDKEYNALTTSICENYYDLCGSTKIPTNFDDRFTIPAYNEHIF